MKKPCPTCRGKGSIDDPTINGPMCYNGPNGETWPQVLCRTCSGTGWVVEVGYCIYPDHYPPEPMLKKRETFSETETFLNNIDVLIRVGGGKPSMEEVEKAKEMKLQVFEYDLPITK